MGFTHGQSGTMHCAPRQLLDAEVIIETLLSEKIPIETHQIDVGFSSCVIGRWHKSTPVDGLAVNIVGVYSYEFMFKEMIGITFCK